MDTNIQELLSQANPSTPDAPPDPTTAQPSATQAAANLLATGAQPAPNAVPSVGNIDPSQMDFKQKLATALLQPANGAKSLGFGGTMVQAAMKAWAPQPTVLDNAIAPGSVPWSAATSNADQTKPTSAPVNQQPNRPRAIANNVFAHLGDAAHATDNGGAGGFMGGVARTAAAGNERQIQAQKDKITMMSANVQMLHEQSLIHKMGDDALNESAKTGQAGVSAVTTPVPGGVAGKTDAKDVDSDQLNQMIKSGEIKPAQQTAFLTGRKVVGTDTNGLPIYRSTYTVVTPAGRVGINQENAKIINDYLGTKFPVTDKESDQQVVPGVQLNQLLQQAYNARAVRQSMQVGQAEASEKIDKAAVETAAKTLYEDPKRVQTLTKVFDTVSQPGKDGEADPLAAVKAYNYIKAHPDVQAQLGIPNFDKVWIEANGGDKAWDKRLQDFDKASEKTQSTAKSIVDQYNLDPGKTLEHPGDVMAAAQARANDPALTPQERQDAKNLFEVAKNAARYQEAQAGATEYSKADAEARAKQRAAGALNPNNLTGPAFIATLPAPRQQGLRAFNEGRLAVNASAMERSPAGQQLLSDLFTAYPDLDTTKGGAYPKLRDDFTTGKAATIINYANTALQHLNEMQDALEQGATVGKIGKIEAGVGKNKPGRDLNVAKDYVVDELGKMYSGGAITEAQKDSLIEGLDIYGSWQTNNKLKENVKEITKLLGGKLEATQQQWDDGVPSKQIAAPKEIAHAPAIATYKRITGEDLRVHPDQQTPAPSPTAPVVPPPAGATNEVLVNGKVVGHTVKQPDGTQKYVALPH